MPQDWFKQNAPSEQQGDFFSRNEKTEAPLTAGQRYMQARRAGKLPRYDASEVPGIRAQQEQYLAADPNRSFLNQMYHGMKSGLIETGGVTDKVLSGLTDPKTLAAFAISKLSPAGLVAAQMYFGLQSSQQMADALQSGKLTPENVQNFLLGASGYVGAGAMSGDTPATIRQRLSGAQAKVQSFARGATEARPAVRAAVEKAADVAKHQDLATSADRQAMSTSRQVEQVENKVWQKNQENWEALKQKIGADQPGEPTEPLDEINGAITQAEQQVLREMPETLPLFKQITKLSELSPEVASQVPQIRAQIIESQYGRQFRGDYNTLRPEAQQLVDRLVQEDLQRRYGSEAQPPAGANWGTLQRIKTSLDNAIRSRTTPRPIRQALKVVQDATVNTMGRMAASKGATADWQAARDFNRQWREDFHEPAGPSGSGSPVAEVLNAKDAPYIQRALRRTKSATGNRAVDILRKYGPYGGNDAATSVENMLTTQEQSAELPKKATGVKVAGLEKPTVDPEAISRKQIGETARRVGRLNAWDARVLAGSAIAAVVAPFIGLKGGIEMGTTYVGAKLGLARALESPKVVDWLAKTPPDEMASLQRLPGADRVKIAGALTDQAVKTGKPVTLSPAAKAFLGPANVARILAASGAGTAPIGPVRTPAQAKQAIPQPVQ